MSIKNILFGAKAKLPFEYISYLLVGNGTNGTTTNIKDSSLNNLTTNIVGNTSISTAQNKFGSGSVYFDGVGDYLTIPANNNLVFTGDFTIEGWFYRTAELSTYDSIFTTRATVSWAASNFNDSLVLNASGYHGLGSGYTAFSSGYTMPLNTWTHFAINRKGTDIGFYFDGVLKHVLTWTGQVGNINYSYGIGLFDSEGGPPRFFFKGYIYNFRISKDIAQYTSTPFTPPTAPFPTS